LQIANCLHEFQTGAHQGIDFSGGIYGPVHVAIMAMIKKVEADPYHGAQLKTMLKDIGDNGRQVSCSICSSDNSHFHLG
jgi:hypothetical protein